MHFKALRKLIRICYKKINLMASQKVQYLCCDAFTGICGALRLNFLPCHLKLTSK